VEIAKHFKKPVLKCPPTHVDWNPYESNALLPYVDQPLINIGFMAHLQQFPHNLHTVHFFLQTVHPITYLRGLCLRFNRHWHIPSVDRMSPTVCAA